MISSPGERAGAAVPGFCTVVDTTAPMERAELESDPRAFGCRNRAKTPMKMNGEHGVREAGPSTKEQCQWNEEKPEKGKSCTSFIWGLYF